ncbi:MAG TPA: universal stress protein [Thermoanaerobaculia bacterium]|nr:universal stress protein [Thermoanaerobaculia bacterium]
MEKLQIRNILVAYDLRDATLPALRYAALLAGRFAAKVTIAYADMSTYPIDLYEATYAPPSEVELAEIRRDLETNARADLIILGTHARTGIRRAFIGSIAEEVLHDATIPVLTIGPELRDELALPRRIVCPMTFSDIAHESLFCAAQLAAGFGAELIVVHVVESVDRMKAAAEETLAKQWIPQEVQNLCTYRTVIAHGDIAERVLACADDFDADLLVIAAERKMFRNTAIFGPNAERFVRFANCPVLTISRPPLAHETFIPEEEAERVESTRCGNGGGLESPPHTAVLSRPAQVDAVSVRVEVSERRVRLFVLVVVPLERKAGPGLEIDGRPRAGAIEGEWERAVVREARDAGIETEPLV